MIQLLFLLIYNLPRVLLLKIFYGKRAKINWIQRISPKCALQIYGDGVLVIGKNCQIPAGCDLTVLRQGKIVLGERVIMNKYCLISSLGSITIGDNCLIGPGVKIFDNNHRFSKKLGASKDLSIGTIRIGNNCWIASNAVIIKGADIGDNCVISAGCVINGRIPAGSIVRPNTNYVIEEIR